MRNWRRTAISRMENSGGQLWKRLRSTKICNARRRIGKALRAFISSTHALVWMFNSKWLYFYSDYKEGHDSWSLKLRSTKVCNARRRIGKALRAFISSTHALVWMFNSKWLYYYSDYKEGHDSWSLKLIIHFHL